jgi:vancomycin resistance protein YoaR
MSDIVGNRKAARITLIVMVIALICVSGYIAFLFLSGEKTVGKDSSDVIVDTGVVYDGVTSLGVDLSGAKRGDVPVRLATAVQDVLDDVRLDFTVEGHTVSLSAYDVGAKIDTGALFKSAYNVGREGGFAARAAQIEQASGNGVDIPYTITWDSGKLEQSVRSKTADLGLQARDATVDIEKTKDEENLMCDMSLNIVPEVIGVDVDFDKLLPALNEKMDSMDCFGGDSVETETTLTYPDITAAQLSEEYQKIGTFKTSYTTSAYGRRYNIWKMADIINGVVIAPGETWSINEEAGPRTYAQGWEGAPGIENGQYETQAGGGICQVSTTLYNAVLRADLEVVDRSHHSWPSDYVDPGLDATISTGKPDFKFKNNTSSPVVIYAKCDGKEKTIEVSIYRSKMDYALDFTSDVQSRSYSGAIYEIPDPTLPAGARVQVLHEHPKVVVDVYKHVYDLEGNETMTTLAYTDIYSNKAAIVRVGPALPGAAS